MENLSLQDGSRTTSPADSEIKLNSFLFFIILFVVQLLFIFQGVDICDGGSYASFYQLIFSSPDSVQYSFMFWLSGVLGGLYMKLFPGLGILGLRMAGIMISTSTIFFAYRLLKNYLNVGHLQLSLFILVLFINNNPKEFYYNNLSAFIYVLVAYFLFNGLRRNNLSLIFISGGFVALNVFNRLPNILAAAIVIGILYYGYLYKNSYRKQIGQCLAFFFGMLVCAGLVLMVMYQLGQLQTFINSLKLLFSMGKTTKQSDGLESNYSLFNLINLLYAQYKFSLIAAILFFVFVSLIVPIAIKIRTKYPSILAKIVFSKFAFLTLMVILIVFGKINYISIIYFFTGICVTTAAIILITNKNKEISFLLFLGIFITLVHPLGSSTGIHTVIIYSFWLSFPISIEYLLTIKKVGLNVIHSGKLAEFSTSLTVTKSQLDGIKKWGIALLIFGCVYYSYFYPYFDRSNRLYMHYSINNKYMIGIYTSKERATALNELLLESSKYAKPNDYVLAYDCMPLYHYLTETKPYLRNSWPWLYQPDEFRNELMRSSSEIKTLPVVIFQKIRTMGPNGGKWPDYSSGETTLNWELNKSRNETLIEFLKINNYKEVWSNKAFEILMPDESNRILSKPILNSHKLYSIPN
jgi:hypothetical protein